MIRTWLQGMCMMCGAAVLADMLLPEGDMRSGVRKAAGLTMTGMFVAMLAEGLGMAG